MKSCDDYEVLLTTYAVNELTGPEEKMVEEHVSDCQRCQKELQDIQSVMGVVSTELASEDLPKVHSKIVLNTSASSRRQPLFNVTRMAVAAILMAISAGIYYRSLQNPEFESPVALKPKAKALETSDHNEKSDEKDSRHVKVLDDVEGTGTKTKELKEKNVVEDVSGKRDIIKKKPAGDIAKEPERQIVEKEKERTKKHLFLAQYLMAEYDAKVDGKKVLDRKDKKSIFINENSFHSPMQIPFSTLSLVTSEKSYDTVRDQDGRPLGKGVKIQTEEMLKHFKFGYRPPDAKSDHPFKLYLESSICPWNKKNILVKMVLKAREENKRVQVAEGIDFRIQFNVALVKSYRLIGYENLKLMAAAKNKNVTLSEGEELVAMYEVALDPESAHVNTRQKLCSFMVAYRDFKTHKNKVVVENLVNQNSKFEDSSSRFKLAASVVGFSMILNHSDHMGNLNFTKVHKWASYALSDKVSAAEIPSYLKIILKCRKHISHENCYSWVKDKDDE